MAGRAQAFRDPTVIALASERFIPVAENSSALQLRPDDKGLYFRHVAEQGHYGGRTYPTTTRQGSYAFTAQGQFLASVNSRDPVRMAEMLRAALARWESEADHGVPAPVQLVGTPPDADSYPENGLVLQVVARDLPRANDTRVDDWRKHAWNLDYAWFTGDEAQALVPEPRSAGARQTAPWNVVRRLARFHLRDCVRGEPFAWTEDAIRHGELGSEIVGLGETAVRLVLRGKVHLEAEVQWVRPEDGEERVCPCGYDCSLYGEATWDDARGKFTAFELAAVGQRWGTMQYNNRADDLGPAPLGIAFGLAGTATGDRTPPHCLRTWKRPVDPARPARASVAPGEYFGGGL